MILLVIALFAVILAYKLLVKGWLWKLIFLVVGTFSIYFTLHTLYPDSNKTALIIANHSISWAVFLPAALTFLDF
jgi:hypothetical protein